MITKSASKTKQYNYGDCIPESVKLYNKLKTQGYNPKMVEGWVEVNHEELLPDEEFLKLYYPEDFNAVNNSKLDFNDYIKVIPHTWVILNNRYIDVTVNQFDMFGGVIKYYEKERYTPKINIKLTTIELTDWYDERDYIIEKKKCIRYPKKI